ncbi:MAG: redox-regulated ATPase YchF [Deltaproteobacteria bacterium]|nr:redox-regulated ATPase YchF [Deltaproteobacteria bacterium]
MGFNCGIIGLPNVGKSTIYNALTAAGAAVANYPFCTIEPNVGTVTVPDDRLDSIARIVKPRKCTPTVMEFVDIAGLVKGASKGEGLGNKFLGHIRDVDAIVHVVRCFDDPNVSHVHGIVDPAGDIATVVTELILADLETVERRRQKAERQAKVGDKSMFRELEALVVMEEVLARGVSARTVPQDDIMPELRRDLNLLTDKKVLYVANVSEDMLRGSGRVDCIAAVETAAEAEGSAMVVLCGDLEAEIVLLPPDEQQVFLEDLGLRESGLLNLIRTGYELLSLITFYTTVGTELRAWTLKAGTTALKAAGKIHSDMERGFIRAEVLSYDDFSASGGIVEARDRGLVRIEGRDYEITDGDIVHFRFNV